jgi:hypothetical protein
MKRAILRESSFCAGRYGAIMESAPAWETREDIDVAVRAVGLKEPSNFQLEVGEMRICCRRRDNCPMPITAAASNIRPEPRAKPRGSWNYCVTTKRSNTSAGNYGGKVLTSVRNIGSRNSKGLRQPGLGN